MKCLRRHENMIIMAGISLLIFLVNMTLPQTASAFRSMEEKGNDRIKDAIVKIYTVKNEPYYFNPWRTLPPKNVNGSGSIIEGEMILTNAHVVADQTFIQVRRSRDSRRYRARVLSISHEADLALLTVDDKTFFSGIKPLGLGDLPDTRQEVVVYGFPVGGDTLSITMGILSRIEHHLYVHNSNYFLAGQIDAPINPGNSGGPVMVSNRLVGVVMQCYDPGNSENIGYMVPAPVIKHFLEDMEDGNYNGFPDLGLIVQKMENPDMKRKYGMPEGQSGVVVNHVVWGSSAREIIKKDDILLAVDGHPVADDGTVEFRPKYRTVYKYFIEMHQMGERVTLDILRKGEIKTVSLALDKRQDDFLLVPNEQYDRKPRYFIFGGIIFSPLTKNFINERKRAPEYLISELENWPTQERQELVIAIQTLGADINRGYHDLYSWMLTEVNGKRFRDFKEFVRIVTESTEPFIVFKNSKGFQIVLDRKKAIAANKNILHAYGIKDDRSPAMERLAYKTFLSQR